uniref:VWFA domain-containing protein n=1 Tax=Plectus sambesii TaxID=2011161 RepID=A0A914WB09_9BILA
MTKLGARAAKLNTKLTNWEAGRIIKICIFYVNHNIHFSVTQADLYQVVELNSRGMVFGMDILGNAIAKTYLDELTLANDYNVFRVPNPSFLVPGTEGFQRLSSFASIAYVEWITNPPVPPILAYSDIVIVFDGSTAMTQSAFNSMVQGWLPSFVRDFAVAPFLTQFSIMTYDWLPVGNPIFFNSSTSRDQLSALIGNITYTQPRLTSFDITTALDYVGSTLLTTANGWRGQSTFVIVVAFNGNTRTSCDIITQAASNLWPKAAIYGLAVPPTPGVDPTTYLTCALPTQKKSYITLSDPVTYATASSPPPSPNFLVQAPLFYAIGKEYQNYIDGQNYTLTVPLSTKVIDIVFVVDKSFYTVQGFGLIIQFMSSYVANFNIGPLGAQVAILGVSDTIDQYLNFNDTNNLSDLQSRINNFQPGNVDVTVNLAQALPILLQTTFHPSNGRRQDVPAMVIILLGSDKLSQPTPDSFEYVADLWRMTDVFGINLYGYARTSEVLEFLARNARNVGVVANISTLLTPGNTAVQKLSYAVSNSMPQRPLPTYLVASDIVILIDGTSSMTQDAFTTTKTWLLSFVNKFFIDRAVAQISVLIYDSSPRAGSIVLNGATDNPGLTTRISNIPWPNSTVTNFDLLGAINYTTARLLTRAQGWRNQSTIVIIVGISPTITTSCNDLRGNNTLRGVAEVLTLALNAQRSTADYLNCIEPFPGLGFTAAIPYSMLIPGGIADTVITNDVTRAYQYGYVDRQPRYPPIPLNLVQLDVVFVVDSTAYTTPAIFSLLQDMMVKFASQFTIGTGQTMFSVISYDQSNWDAGSFPLTRATDLNSLQRSIYALQARNSSTIYQIDIAGAMDYVSNLILTPNQGHTNGRAAAVIILANTPNSVSLPNSNQIARLNSMGGVFGVDIPGQGASTYLLYAANFNDRNVLRAYGAGNLNFQRNFDQLTYFASSVYYSWLTNPPVPTVATLADIVIVIDSSQAVSQSFFNPLKQWLTTYVAQYSVGSSLTQFAIVFYDNAPRYNVITFNSATNGVQIQNALNGITFSASSQTNWDIRGAINYVASSVLTTQNGFRGQSAVVILASASASPTFSSSDCAAITAASLILARNATVLGLSLNPASTPNSYQSLVCAVGTANSASVYGAQMGATLAGTTAELQLSYAISLNYQKYVDSLPYDVPYPLISKSVDLVFLIDQSYYTYRSFDQLKQWLASYVDNFTLSNGAGGTQIAVVGVGRLSTAPRNVTQYIALNRTSDPSTLKSLIQFIEHDEETVITPDIDGALQFIEQTSLQPQSGRRPNVPAVTIILLGSGLLDPVQPSTAAILQGMSNVFGMNLYGYPAATNLLLQLTNGNDAAVGRMGNISTLLMPNNLPVRMLNSFISNSQLSWTQLAAADFVFVIDQTRMSSDDFNSVKSYLTQLISQFQIGTNYSQFAVVQFAKTPFVIGNNIALNGATSNAVLVNRINSLPYIGGGPTATDAADLNGALAAVNNTYLMPSQGWRQNQGTSTFVVIIATASSATNATNAPSTVVSDLQAKDSYIYGYDAANLALRDSYLRNYYTPNVITLSSASSLTVSSSANKNFLDFVQSNTNAGL